MKNETAGPLMQYHIYIDDIAHLSGLQSCISSIKLPTATVWNKINVYQSDGVIYVSAISRPIIENGGIIIGYRVIIYRYDPITIGLILEIDSDTVPITKGKALRCREAVKLVRNISPTGQLDVHEHPIRGSIMHKRLIYVIVPTKWRDLTEAFGAYNVTLCNDGYVGYNLF